MSDNLPDVEDGVDYDSESGTYRAVFDSSKTKPSIAAVEVLATVKGKEPTELAPLYNTIDPEALDRFLTTTGTGTDPGDRQVEFEFDGYTVTVTSCGIVKVQHTDSVSEE